MRLCCGLQASHDALYTRLRSWAPYTRMCVCAAVCRQAMAVLDAAERSLPSSYVSRSSPMTYIGPGANTHGLCRQIITPDLNQVRMLCVCVCMCVQIFSHDVHRSWANTHGLCRQIITPDLNQVRVLCVCVLCVCVVACTLIYRGPTDLKHMCAHMLALDIGLCCRWYLREPI